MTYSELKIKFNEELSENSKVKFNINTLQVSETWKNSRTSSNQVAIGTPTRITGQRSAINFANSFNLDYNGGGVYVVSVSGNEVTIKSTNNTLMFSSGSGTKIAYVSSSNGCTEYELAGDSSGGDGAGQTTVFSFTRCDNSLGTMNVPSGDSVGMCAKTNTVSITQGDGTITVTGSCSETVATSVSANISFTYNNYEGIPFEIDSISFEESSSPCSHIKVKVTTSELATQITSPISQSNTDNPFYFETLRHRLISVTCNNSANDIESERVFTPILLDSENYEITVYNSPNGASVSIADNTPTSSYPSLNVEYSLNDIDWQSANVFSGQVSGDYTLYIRDNYGCKVQKEFLISDVGINTPFFYISESNSFRFAKRVNWSTCGDYKNDANTLSCEANVKLPKKEIQQFNNCDTITTQYKSNYETTTLEVIDLDDGGVSYIESEKKTENIGIKDKRDARVYSYNGKLAIYFLSGKKYDYETGVYQGDNYILNGALPEWGVEGNYTLVDGIWYEIESVIYDDDKEVEAIVTSGDYSSSEVDKVVGCIYNRFEYDVYEFSISMLSFSNKNFQVKITNTDSSFDELVYLSEQIRTEESHDDTVEITYTNDTNTDIYYSTGIVHKIRIPIERVNAKIDDDSETYKTDTTAILLNAEVFKIDEFVFDLVTKGIMTKLTQALSHRNITIDGVSYVKNSTIEVEGALGDTNLYKVTAAMVRSDNGYTNDLGDSSLIIATEPIEVPNLIEGESDGFIRH